jgi:hypothetical protein
MVNMPAADGAAATATLVTEAPAAETAADEPSEVHDLVTCAGCGLKPIRGPRWKCNQCADFDLCDICHGQFRRSGRNHIGGHTFRRIGQESERGVSHRAMPNGKHPLVKFVNGDAYEGEWLNGNRHGRGILTSVSGNR